MENLHNYLPKDLVNIVEEYSKDRTNYDEVLKELEADIICGVFDYDLDYDLDMICKGSSTHCPCDGANTFRDMRSWTPDCYEGFIELRNKMVHKLTANYKYF